MKAMLSRPAMTALMVTLLCACSGGSSSELENVVAVYTAADPGAEATGAESNEPLALEVVGARGAVVEVQ